MALSFVSDALDGDDKNVVVLVDAVAAEWLHYTGLTGELLCHRGVVTVSDENDNGTWLEACRGRGPITLMHFGGTFCGRSADVLSRHSAALVSRGLRLRRIVLFSAMDEASHVVGWDAPSEGDGDGDGDGDVQGSADAHSDAATGVRAAIGENNLRFASVEEQLQQRVGAGVDVSVRQCAPLILPLLQPPAYRYPAPPAAFSLCHPLLSTAFAPGSLWSVPVPGEGSGGRSAFIAAASGGEDAGEGGSSLRADTRASLKLAAHTLARTLRRLGFDCFGATDGAQANSGTTDGSDGSAFALGQAATLVANTAADITRRGKISDGTSSTPTKLKPAALIVLDRAMDLYSPTAHSCCWLDRVAEASKQPPRARDDRFEAFDSALLHRFGTGANLCSLAEVDAEAEAEAEAESEDEDGANVNKLRQNLVMATSVDEGIVATSSALSCVLRVLHAPELPLLHSSSGQGQAKPCDASGADTQATRLAQLAHSVAAALARPNVSTRGEQGVQARTRQQRRNAMHVLQVATAMLDVILRRTLASADIAMVEAEQAMQLRSMESVALSVVCTALDDAFTRIAGLLQASGPLGVSSALSLAVHACSTAGAASGGGRAAAAAASGALRSGWERFAGALRQALRERCTAEELRELAPWRWPDPALPQQAVHEEVDTALAALRERLVGIVGAQCHLAGVPQSGERERVPLVGQLVAQLLDPARPKVQELQAVETADLGSVFGGWFGAKKSEPKQPAQFGTIFIFVLGGVTFAEIGAVQRLVRDAPPGSPTIVVGTNTVPAGGEICKRVLGGRLH